jgi:hypothetical protein
MKAISIGDLHERTGAGIRKAVELGSIPFRERRLRPGYARLRGTLTWGTNSTMIVSEDRGSSRSLTP